MTGKKDYWSAQTYAGSANFVYNAKITQKVLQYLDPQPTDKVLDVGCGDAKFTANYLGQVAQVFGVDASPSFIKSAQADYGSDKAHFKLVDCRYLENDQEAVSGQWDKVVSNAALHWILCDEKTRMNTLRACHDSLRAGGKFVFEMGGAGNVGEVHAALMAALMHQGLSAEQVREADPWFFPSEKWMHHALEQVGFQVKKLELEYRPTPCTDEKEGGLEGWVRLMGAQQIEALGDKEKQDAAVKEVCEILETIVTRAEDGSKWLGYVRLRGIAVKPGS